MTKCRFTGRIAISFTVVLFTLIYVSAVAGAPPDNGEGIRSSPEYVAFYFYTNKRCGPCTTIEKWSQAAIEGNFKDEMDSGRLQFRALNVEKPENRHYIKAYQLYTKSVIIARYQDGKPIQWKNLSDVWKLYRDKEKFFEYIVQETSQFMENK